ncbi:hypothetical protein [Spirosoma koreense]
MKVVIAFLFMLGIGIGFSCSQKNSSVAPIDSQVVGQWKLIRIVNGFAQINQTPEAAGYSETLDYKADGTYLRVTTRQSGQQEENGTFYTGPNPTQTGEKQAILYPEDKTTQPYSFHDGHLFLYQRGRQEGTIADGSTFEYQRQ